MRVLHIHHPVSLGSVLEFSHEHEHVENWYASEFIVVHSKLSWLVILVSNQAERSEMHQGRGYMNGFVLQVLAIVRVVNRP